MGSRWGRGSRAGGFSRGSSTTVSATSSVGWSENLQPRTPTTPLCTIRNSATCAHGERSVRAQLATTAETPTPHCAEVHAGGNLQQHRSTRQPQAWAPLTSCTSLLPPSPPLHGPSCTPGMQFCARRPPPHVDRPSPCRQSWPGFAQGRCTAVLQGTTCTSPPLSQASPPTSPSWTP